MFEVISNVNVCGPCACFSRFKRTPRRVERTIRTIVELLSCDVVSVIDH